MSVISINKTLEFLLRAHSLTRSSVAQLLQSDTQLSNPPPTGAALVHSVEE